MNKRCRKLEDYLHKKLQSPAYVLAYLNAALADQDKQVFLIALKNVLEAQEQDLTALAEETDISRQNIYRILSPKGNPRWENITSIMNAMDLQINVSFKGK